MNLRFIPTLILLALFTCTTLACRCRRKSFIQAFNDAKRYGSAPYAVATVLSEDRPSNINGRVMYTLRIRGCGNTVTATTCGNSACCGVRLTVLKTYALPLKRDGTPSSLNSCGRNPLFDSLPLNERRLVESITTPSRCTVVANPFSCQGVRCSSGSVCRSGRCVRACAVVRCPGGTVCRGGRCVDPCSSIRCGTGSKCLNGKCVAVNTGSRCYKRCFGVQCVRGRCEESCRTYGCFYGYTCVHGQCRHSRPWYYEFRFLGY